MSKNRLRVWLAIMLCTGLVLFALLKKDGIDSAYQFISAIGMEILFYACLCIGVFILGKWLEKQFGLERKSAVALSVIAVVLIGMLVIFYQSEERMDQLQEEHGTVAAVGKVAITAEEIGLHSSADGTIDSGESYWKSWLDYTVMMENDGSFQYNCERFVDAEDAERRLDNYIESDLFGKEFSELPVQKAYTGIDRIEAYEWLTGEDTGIRIFYYYVQAGDMTLRVKYRGAECLEDNQLESLMQWFLEE